MKLFDPSLRVNLNPQNFALDEFVMLDVEASGLGHSSYPVEVAFASSTGRQASYLIQPTSYWLAHGEWDENAERLHGLSQQTLLFTGSCIANVAQQLNKYLCGKLVLCNDLAFDGFWLSQLFKAANTSVTFHLMDLSALFDFWGEQKKKVFKEEYGKTLNTNEHRALPDAKRFVETYQAFVKKQRLHSGLTTQAEQPPCKL
ncbi:exonuclease domain-containing protein [Pseudoalteromonas gelatinilytica]